MSHHEIPPSGPLRPSLLAMADALRDERDVTEQEAPRRRRLGTIAGLSLAGAVLGGAAAMAWPQTYVATSEVMLSDAMENPSGVPGEADLAMIETRLRLLRSGTVMNAAAERLNLAADPEFGGDGRGPFGTGDYARTIRQIFAPDGGTDEETRRQRAVAALQRAVEIRRVGNSAVVAVTARSSDPEKSALLANAVSEAFLSSAGGVTRAADIDRLQAELDAAEQALAEFRRTSGLNVTTAELSRLDQQLAAARQRAAALDVQVADGGGAGIDPMATGSVGAAVAPALEEARARHAMARQKVESLSKRLGPRHPELIAAQAELDGTRQEMDAEARRIAANLEAEKTDAERAAQDLAARLDQIRNDGEGLATLRGLEHAADMRRAALDDALRTGAAGAASQESWIISQAERPLEAAGPSAPMLSLAGALGGLFAGLGFAGWRRAPGTDEDDGQDEAWDHALPDEQTDAYSHAEPDEPYGDAMAAKEAPEMYPYPQHAYPAAPRHPQAQNDQHHPAQMPYAAPPAPVPAMPAFHPHQMQDAWGMAGYPVQHGHLMGWPQPQMPAVVYVPVPAQQMMPAVQPRDDYPRASQSDRRTEAAIEEIRQSLRDLREAIEDFADQRYG